MTYRVTDRAVGHDSISRINEQRNRLAVFQERISTGKRINRPSDDPGGAEVVLNLRTSQREIEQFQRNADAASQKLTSTDDALTGYQTLLERVRTLVTQGLSDTTTQDARNALATELGALRTRILAIANSQNGDTYIFGGTRQNAPPFDPTTAAPASTPTTAQYVQIEPGAVAVPTGVTAETVFGDSTSTLFVDIASAITALRGTGNPAADRATLENTNSRLGVYSGLANNARAIVGAYTNSTDLAKDSLSSNFLSLDERASDLENADFADTAIGLADAQRALDATLQATSQGRRSLFDYFG